jgi:hypothetical protein
VWQSLGAFVTQMSFSLQDLKFMAIEKITEEAFSKNLFSAFTNHLMMRKYKLKKKV